MEKNEKNHPYVGQWLVESHRSCGFSAHVFKQEAHVGNDTYADIVYGRRFVSAEVYAKIWEYLFTQLDEEELTKLCVAFVKYLIGLRRR